MPLSLDGTHISGGTFNNVAGNMTMTQIVHLGPTIPPSEERRINEAPCMFPVAWCRTSDVTPWALQRAPIRLSEQRGRRDSEAPSRMVSSELMFDETTNFSVSIERVSTD
jgi:hypothetical protein